jgi:hypothetical protein
MKELEQEVIDQKTLDAVRQEILRLHASYDDLEDSIKCGDHEAARYRGGMTGQEIWIKTN